MIPQEKFQDLTGTIASVPIIEEKRKGRIESATYQFNEYPAYKFQVVGEHFRMLNSKAKKINIGAKMELKIFKSEYLEKIKKTAAPNLRDKHINWHVINLYEISHNGVILLNINEINSSRSNPIPKLLMMLFGIGIFVYYGYISKGYD